ncbi:MAG: DEAD/DEAH box helicase family protein, partial [Pseudoalteromonas sp.]|nr:DEAD/DEAH box helicase family protein [Pseudoalteromonas sp.]
MSKLYDLRPHQVQTMSMLRDSFKKGLTRPVVYLPTGAGKTCIAAHIIAGALDKGKRVTFVAPRINLCDQTAKSLMDQGLPKPSIMQGSHPWFDPGNRFQIATNQTLSR